MNSNRLIRCRYQLAADCMHNRPDNRADPWQEDGTYRRSSNTICCDACYVLLMPLTPSGMGRNDELDEAALAYQRARDRP